VNETAARAPFDAAAARLPTMMIEIGMARPRAHGHANEHGHRVDQRMGIRGPGPSALHTMNVSSAATVTAGTNQLDTQSARR
jgi:hypothetical protein